MTYELRLPEPEPLSIKKSAKRHLFISDDCVRRVKQILDERRNPPEPKRKETITNNLVHPHSLLPIHLSKEPITVDYQTVPLPDPPIKRRLTQESAKQRPASTLTLTSLERSTGSSTTLQSRVTATAPTSYPELPLPLLLLLRHPFKLSTLALQIRLRVLPYLLLQTRFIEFEKFPIPTSGANCVL